MNQENSQPRLAFKEPGSTGWRSLVATSESESDSTKRGKDELKQMLLNSLQMQHLVVLAGSGCSITAGGPSMHDLWCRVVGATPTDDAVVTAKRVNYSLENNNIEAFLSRIEAYLQVQEDRGVQDFIHNSKQQILTSCSAFLKPENLEHHTVFLHRLSRRRVRDQRLKVFTTNYDLCFERAASLLGGVALDGFSFVAPRRYDPRFFGYDIIRRPRSGDDLGNYLEGVFLLYKLHGSVNWARCNGDTIHEKVSPSPEEACLIYPATGKYQQSFVQPHLESMAQYLAALREPNTCLLVVGFGFNDEHLSEPLLAAIRSNPHLRVVIVDVGAEEKIADSNSNRYWPQLSELTNRAEDVWFISAPFAEFGSMIPDLKALTPADALMKAVQGVVKDH